MHILTIPDGTTIDPSLPLSCGEYLIEDRNGAEIMLRIPGSSMTPYESPRNSKGIDGMKYIRPPRPGEDRGSHTEIIHPSRIVIIAPMGFGDAILLTPCLRQIKDMLPNATLHIATFPECRQVFSGLPYVDGFDDYPIPVDRLEKYDCILSIENAIEFNAAAKVQHMSDRFAEHLGLGKLKDTKADYRMSSDEETWVKQSFPRNEKRRIGVQVQAGAHYRTYPAAHLKLLVSALVRDSWEVFLLGRPGEFLADDAPGMMNLSRRGLTWRQSAAFLTTCDCFVGPDSSLLHAAGALNVPAVGLFGPIPWKLRTAYYESVHALQGHEGCSTHPCFHTEHLGMPWFPVDQPCAQAGYCCVLASILPARVLAKIEQITSVKSAVSVPASGAVAHLRSSSPQ